MIKLMLLVVFSLPIPIVVFYFYQRFIQESYKKRKEKEKQLSEVERKARDLKVECAYADVRYTFNQALKSKNITRTQLLNIKHYLERQVMMYEHKKFKNDAHAIYTMLQANDITVTQLNHVKRCINS